MELYLVKTFSVGTIGPYGENIHLPRSFVQRENISKSTPLHCYDTSWGVLYTPSPLSPKALSNLLSLSEKEEPKEPRKPGRPKKKEEQEEEPKPQFRLGPHGELLDPSVKDIEVVPGDPPVSAGLEAMFRAEIAGKIPQK